MAQKVILCVIFLMSDIISFISLYLKEISAIIISSGVIFAFLRSISAKLKPYKEIGDKIEYIYKELNTNSGTSIKDQISKIEKETIKNTQTINCILYRQRWILDNRPEPIFETDSSGNFTWVNDAFVKLVKRNFDDLMNHKWKIIICENERTKIYEHWDSAIQEKRNFEETVCISSKNGNCFSAKCIAACQEDGKYIGTLTDIEPCKH